MTQSAVTPTLSAVMISTPARESTRMRSVELLLAAHPGSFLPLTMVVSGERTPTENVIEALKEGLRQGGDYVLFLEDDIEPCKDLLGSVGRWLSDHARASIPIYSFSVPHPKILQAKTTDWIYPTTHFCCTQAFAVDSKFLPGLIDWMEKHPTVTGPDGGVSTGAYDLAIRYWLQSLRVPYILASVPSFVQHADVASTITPGKNSVRMPRFGGPDYSYEGPPVRSTPPVPRTRPRVLWIGDAGCDSGFARATHEILKTVSQEWEVRVLGINYRGEPHNYPYPMHPAARNLAGEDVLGAKRMPEVIDGFEPDVVVLQNDPWNIPHYGKAMSKITAVRPKFVGVLAVDGLNFRDKLCAGLDHAIFWTEFAQNEAKDAGLKIPTTVIPLGVDLQHFTPGDKVEARKALGLPEDVCREDVFIFGNVNRNQPRKRMDLTIRYFAQFLEQTGAKNAYLYLHVCPTGDVGINVSQLAAYYGFNVPEFRRLILASPDTWKGASEEDMVRTYRAFDVQITTTQGEGFGLTTIEGMACGIPQILPDWSALGEWAKSAARMVHCSSTTTTPVANAIGGIMDERAAVAAMCEIYRQPEALRNLRERGLALVREQKFRWERIGRQYLETLNAIWREAQGRSGDDPKDSPGPEAVSGRGGVGPVSGDGDRLDGGQAPNAG